MVAAMLSLVIAFLSCSTVLATVERTFQIDYAHNTFLKDGVPFRYVSGSFHYSRVHPDYWKDRLIKMRAAGLNALQGYVPWNVHELSPGNFTWEGASDLGRFLTLAQQADLLVLLRLGPYICGEWEFGGFPAWLLSEDPNMALRTNDSSYTKWVDKWFTELLTKIKPYMYNNGGPILMVQIENEYGSHFPCCKDYMLFLRDKVWSILGNSTVIYTTDGARDRYLRCGKVKGVYATVDFGVTENATDAFKLQRTYQKSGPLVNSEFYTGWLDHWGYPHSQTDSEQLADSLKQILSYGANVNMYMFVGGTNFGYYSGANGLPYHPVTTSYDYDSPISEAGDTGIKFHALRNITTKHLSLPHVTVPPNTNKMKRENITVSFVSTIQEALPYLSPKGPINLTYPESMEKINFYFGYILYRFKLKKNYSGIALNVPGIKDRAVVMVNSVPIGIIDRDGSLSVTITGTHQEVVDILVENQGRIGYGRAMNNNTKGIVQNVTLGDEVVTDWQVYPISLENIGSLLSSGLQQSAKKPLKSADGNLLTPSIFVGDVLMPDTTSQPQDTFLDPRPWGKGQAFINSFNIGRYWPNKGPQVTLYIPAPAFNKSPMKNYVYLFELESSPCFGSKNQESCSITLTDKPYLNGPNGPGLKKQMPAWYYDPKFHFVH